MEQQACSTVKPVVPPTRLLHPRYPPYPRVFQPKGSSSNSSQYSSQLQLPASYMTYSTATTRTSSIVRRGPPGAPPEIIVTPSGSIVTSPMSPEDQILTASGGGGGGGYRRNDPTNRAYNMKKRPPAQVYHCPQCDKHIKYPSKITEHIRKHTGEKAHQCGMCRRSFSQAHTLKAHMATHEHETPYKCSYCPMEFQDPVDKEEHEESHLEPQEDVTPTIQIDPRRRRRIVEAPPILDEEEEEEVDPEDVVVGGEGEEDGGGGVDQQMCQIFECPEMCGFQSFHEHEVVAHIQMAQHGHHHLNEYETVCWTEEEAVVAEEKNADTVLVHSDYPPNSEQLYEYFPEQFVPQVESEESIIQESSTTVTGACTSDYYDSNPREGILYEEEEEVVVGMEQKVIKQEDGGGGGGGGGIYRNIMIQHHLTSTGHHLGVDDEGVSEVVEGVVPGQSHMRVFGNPNPPKRGTKSLRDHHEATAAMTDIFVDTETFVMAQPRPLKYHRVIQQQGGGGGGGDEKRKTRKKTMNVDWIIDAVAKGRDVNEASPHVRKKPTVHQCEYCGKVNKYPSKIRAHMRTHTGEKPFKCDICGMQFSQKTPMRLHLRRHLNQMPFPCDVDGCMERFVSASLLKQHIEKKHLMKKKFVCRSGCGRVFSSAYNLRQHEKKCVTVPNSHHYHHHQQSRGAPGEFEEDLDDEEDEEEMMEEDGGVYMMGHMMEAESIPEQHFVEEPVFLHQ